MSGGNISLDPGLRLSPSTSLRTVVFIIRFFWASASETEHLYSAVAAKMSHSIRALCFQKVIISWQFSNNYGQSAAISLEAKHRITEERRSERIRCVKRCGLMLLQLFGPGSNVFSSYLLQKLKHGANDRPCRPCRPVEGVRA